MTISGWRPWEHYPGLLLERLLLIAEIIRAARDGAADDHRPDKGETNWSLGVRCYERTCVALTWAAFHELPWLLIASGAGGGPVHFVMTIGGHPVRFYRGDPDEIPARYQQPSIFELMEQAKALALDADLPRDRALRIAIENDTNGRPNNIYLVEMDETEAIVTQIFMVPVMAKTTTVTDFMTHVPPAKIPPVTAEAAEGEEQADKDKKDDKTGSDDE
jgi:hypothetical protein